MTTEHTWLSFPFHFLHTLLPFSSLKRDEIQKQSIENISSFSYTLSHKEPVSLLLPFIWATQISFSLLNTQVYGHLYWHPCSVNGSRGQTRELKGGQLGALTHGIIHYCPRGLKPRRYNAAATGSGTLLMWAVSLNWEFGSLKWANSGNGTLVVPDLDTSVIDFKAFTNSFLH